MAVLAALPGKKQISNPAYWLPGAPSLRFSKWNLEKAFGIV
jgi:hypothetical protein